MWVLSKVALPRIGEALEKRANAIRESIEAAERQRQEADQLLNEYRERLKEAREQAEDIVARARKAAEAAAAEAVSEGKEKREELVAARARHRDRDPPLAGADPQGGRRPDGARHREGDPQGARLRGPPAPDRGGPGRGRLLRPWRATGSRAQLGELDGGDRRAYTPRPCSRRPATTTSSMRFTSSLTSSPTPLRRIATSRSSSSAPTSPRPRSARDLARGLRRRARADQLPRAARREAPDAGDLPHPRSVRRTLGGSEQTPRGDADERHRARPEAGWRTSAPRSSVRPNARSTFAPRSTRGSSAASGCGSATWCSTPASAQQAEEPRLDGW